MGRRQFAKVKEEHHLWPEIHRFLIQRGHMHHQYPTMNPSLSSIFHYRLQKPFRSGMIYERFPDVLVNIMLDIVGET